MAKDKNKGAENSNDAVSEVKENVIDVVVAEPKSVKKNVISKPKGVAGGAR